MSALIEKGAELVGVTPQVFVITIAILVVLFIIIFIKITLDEKKGVNSQEKAEIRKIIDNLVPNGNQYVDAYAHSKEVYGGARMRREVYHYYAIGFREDQPDHLWVVPIGVEGGKIVYTKPVRASAENVNYVGGNKYELWLMFPGGKDSKYIIKVDGSNTKMGKECQVNIQQQEEEKAFTSFAEKFQECVNAQRGVDKKGRVVKK